MLKRISMTNSDIYNIATNILKNFSEDINLPVKINFYLQKNINEIVGKASELDQARNSILEKYGTLNEELLSYSFKEEDIPSVNKEIGDLFSLEQEVKVYELELDWFDSVELSSSALASILYMFKEEEE